LSGSFQSQLETAVAELRARDQQLLESKQALLEREEKIVAFESQLKKLQAASNHRLSITEQLQKKSTIEQASMIIEKEKLIEEKDKLLEEKTKQLADRDKQLAEKEQLLKFVQQQLADQTQKTTMFKQMTEQLQKQKEEYEQQSILTKLRLTEKEEKILSLEQRLKSSSPSNDHDVKQMKEQKDQIEDLTKQVATLQKELVARKQLITQLTNILVKVRLAHLPVLFFACCLHCS
jgi:chromosome segregation ATPase